MVSGKHKSNTMRKVFVKTPGSRTVVHYRKKKPSKSKCGTCGAVLSGAPSLRPVKMSKLSKTQKRPERPFGGVLCSKCSRQVAKVKAR